MAEDLLALPPIGVAPDEEQKQRRSLLPPIVARPLQPVSQAATPLTLPPIVPHQEQRSDALEPAVKAPQPTSTALPPIGKAEMAEPIAANPHSLPPTPIGPQQQRYDELSQKGAPELHGWKKALDAIGSIFPIGRNIESAIPGSPQNYDARLNQAALRAAREQSLTEGQQKIQSQPAAADLNRRNVESEISARGNKDDAALAKIGMKRDQEGNIVPDEQSEIFKGQESKRQSAEATVQNLNALREAQTELAQARTEVEKSKNDPNSPAFKQAQQRLIQAQHAHEVAAQNLGLHQAEFANKLHEQDLVKPSGQSQSRGSAAQAVLDLIPDLKTLVNKHREDMGPLMGRINRGEVAIGNVDPKVARLYSAMKSFYALQPAVHGFRNAEFVKDFESALGTLERNPDAFIAGMEGLKPTLESVAKEGKTFHKRIVEGEAPSSGGSNFADWKKNQKP